MIPLISVFLLFGLNSIVNGFVCMNDGHFANPDDKHSFFQCSFGTPYLMQCPPTLVWSQDKYTCDYDTFQPIISCDDNKVVNCRENSKWSSDGIAFVGQDIKFGSDSLHLGAPFGVFIDTEHGNNIYVADTDNHRVQKFLHGSLTSGGITVAGGNSRGNASNQLDRPSSIYVDKDENVYVADNENNRVQLWAKGATSGITVAGGHGKGKALNQIGACQGIFVHEKTKTLYVSDFYNDRVVKWTEGSHEGIIVAGSGTSGSKANQLTAPRGIFVDQCETIYVTDPWNNRVQKWKKDATEGITVAGGNGKGSDLNQLNFPWDVQVDQYNNIYIMDTDNSRVVKWSSNQLSGEIILGGNGSGIKSNQFKQAHSLALDKQGNIFVTERLNHRVQMFQIDNQTITC
ncbi:unnamed protein product [Adineta steineri]|uniref:Chitin-binding type-2 domain-containing protein n=1 Tax=Adineta steineri TaxID=433720 RepID=A0A819GU86_9BILA|nr:unnamed protein product [Adineta steineri]CAF3887282.1 unnamed protein product [Adineta steineri]